MTGATHSADTARLHDAPAQRLRRTSAADHQVGAEPRLGARAVASRTVSAAFVARWLDWDLARPKPARIETPAGFPSCWASTTPNGALRQEPTVVHEVAVGHSKR